MASALKLVRKARKGASSLTINTGGPVSELSSAGVQGSAFGYTLITLPPCSNLVELAHAQTLPDTSSEHEFFLC